MLDKTNRTGSTFQLINGYFLVATFFSVRLMYGGYTVRLHPFTEPAINPRPQSYHFFQTLYNGRHVITRTVIALTGAGNVLLQGLNWFWCAALPSLPSFAHQGIQVRKDDLVAEKALRLPDNRETPEWGRAKRPEG